MFRKKNSKKERDSGKPSSHGVVVPKKRFGLEEIIEILFTLLFAFVGYFLTDVLLPPELKVLSADGKTIVPLFSKEACLFFKLFFSLSAGLLGLFSSAYYYERLNWKRKIIEIIEKLGIVEDRLTNVLEHAAFFTEDDKLEKTALSLLWQKTGGPAWIAAKFISKQLSDSFSVLKFDINGDDYSDFSGKLYPECTSSIFLTSPFTPAEWFRQLYPDHADDVINEINKGGDLSYSLPSHVESLISAKKAGFKKRLVILPSGNWLSLNAQEKLLEKFLEMNEGIETRFVEKEKLTAKYPFVSEIDFDFSKYDYAIFDNEILLKWERPGKANEKRPLFLIDLKNVPDSRIEKFYKQIVSEIFAFTPGQHMEGKQVLNKIREWKRGLKDKVSKGEDLPHKLSYFAIGSTAWSEVAKDPSYDLGKREIFALRKSLRKYLGQDRTSWNILHVGPGEGREIPVVVEEIGIERIKSYALIDISPELVEIAAAFGRKTFENIKFFTYVRDITENDISAITEDLRKKYAPQNLVLLVGNGAIISNSGAFNTITSSSKPQDRVIITVEAFEHQRREQILDQYKLPSIIKLLSQPLALIGIHDLQDTFFKPEYNDRDSLVEIYFLLRDWKAQYPERMSAFNNFPDRIKVFASLRPKPEMAQWKALLEQKGVRVEDCEIMVDEHCCSGFCSVPSR